MKKLIYYLIFLLALVMMMLCSYACRSPKTVTYSQAITDSVKLSVKDSTNQRFEFTFDSLELWSELRNFETSELRNSQAQPSSEIPNFFLRDATKALRDNRTSENSHHIVVYGGKLLSDKTRAIAHDSIRNKSSSLAQHSVVPCYRSSVIPYAIAIAIAILLFFLIRLRSSS